MFCRSDLILIFSYCDLCTTSFLWSRLRRTLHLAVVRYVRYWCKQNCLAPSSSRLYSPTTELFLIVQVRQGACFYFCLGKLNFPGEYQDKQPLCGGRGRFVVVVHLQQFVFALKWSLGVSVNQFFLGSA